MDESYRSQVEQAKQDYKQLTRQMRGVIKRKSATEWSCPLEVFLICMQPGQATRKHYSPQLTDEMEGNTTAYEKLYREGAVRARAGLQMVGLGFSLPVEDFSFIRRRFTRLLAHGRQAMAASLIAHRSRGVPIAKPNGLTGTAGLRTIHNIRPFCWSWLRYLWIEGDVAHSPSWPSYAHGFLPLRRREDAIASQRIMTEKSRKSRIPHLNTLHDLTNAFASVDQQELLSGLSPLTREQDETYLEQRICNSHCAITGLDGDFQFTARDGGFMGSSELPRFFLRAFTGKIAQWNTHFTAKEQELIVDCAVTEAKVDGSLNTLADDVCKKRPVKHRTTAEAIRNLTETNEILQAALAEVSFKQNLKKQDIVPSIAVFAEDFPKVNVKERTEGVRVSRIDRTYQSSKKKIMMHIEREMNRKKFIAAMLQIPRSSTRWDGHHRRIGKGSCRNGSWVSWSPSRRSGSARHNLDESDASLASEELDDEVAAW